MYLWQSSTYATAVKKFRIKARLNVYLVRNIRKPYLIVKSVYYTVVVGHPASRKNNNLAKTKKSRIQVQQNRTPAKKNDKQERQPGIRRKIRNSEVITETINVHQFKIRNPAKTSSPASHYSYIGIRYSIEICTCRAARTGVLKSGAEHKAYVVPEAKEVIGKMTKRRHMYRYDVQNATNVLCTLYNTGLRR